MTGPIAQLSGALSADGGGAGLGALRAHLPLEAGGEAPGHSLLPRVALAFGCWRFPALPRAREWAPVGVGGKKGLSGGFELFVQRMPAAGVSALAQRKTTLSPAKPE